MSKQEKQGSKKTQKHVKSKNGENSREIAEAEILEELENYPDDSDELEKRRTEIRQSLNDQPDQDAVSERCLFFATYVIQFMAFLQEDLVQASTYYSYLLAYLKKSKNNVYAKYSQHMNNIYKKASVMAGPVTLADSHVQSLYKELPEVLHTIVQGQSMYWFLTESEKDELRQQMYDICREKLHEDFTDEEIVKIVKLLLSPEYYISAAHAYNNSKRFQQQIMTV